MSVMWSICMRMNFAGTFIKVSIWIDLLRVIYLFPSFHPSAPFSPHFYFLPMAFSIFPFIALNPRPLRLQINVTYAHHPTPADACSSANNNFFSHSATNSNKVYQFYWKCVMIIHKSTSNRYKTLKSWRAIAHEKTDPDDCI